MCWYCPPAPSQRLWALLTQDLLTQAAQGGLDVRGGNSESPNLPSIRGTIPVLQPAPQTAPICTEPWWLTEEAGSTSEPAGPGQIKAGPGRRWLDCWPLVLCLQLRPLSRAVGTSASLCRPASPSCSLCWERHHLYPDAQTRNLGILIGSLCSSSPRYPTAS